MKRSKKQLIMQDEYISVYEEKLIDYVPTSKRIGGYISVVNNLNNERCWKEWKWYSNNDGTMFNDRDHVIDMLSYCMKRL